LTSSSSIFPDLMLKVDCFTEMLEVGLTAILNTSSLTSLVTEKSRGQ